MKKRTKVFFLITYMLIAMENSMNQTIQNNEKKEKIKIEMEKVSEEEIYSTKLEGNKEKIKDEDQYEDKEDDNIEIFELE